MTDALEVAQHIRGLTLNIFDHEQITVVNDATGDVMVNLVAKPGGYNLIHHDVSLTEEQAISMAVLMLIDAENSLLMAYIGGE